MAIQVYAEGPTLVIGLSNYVESTSMFQFGQSIMDSPEEIFQKVSINVFKIKNITNQQFRN